MNDVVEAESNIHQSGDHLLTALLSVGGNVEKFVLSYPGLEKSLEDDSWINDWFIKRVEHFMLADDADPGDLSLCYDTSIQQLTVKESIVTAPAKLISVQPNYFRGFRLLGDPIDLSPNLVVLDGCNSSGKTSLSEALEWLFSGELTRRKMQNLGDPKELENCIANQLMPSDEECWVHAILEDQNGKHLALKRVLISDYGSTITSRPESQLFLDGQALTDVESDDLLMNLFAGVPPLLMQHSLRSFVLSSPSQRRDYFENLLNLDELTHLIEKAVVGKAHVLLQTEMENRPSHDSIKTEAKNNEETAQKLHPRREGIHPEKASS